MELHESKIKKFFNFMFPLIVFLLLLLTLVTRALLCFDRTEVSVLVWNAVECVDACKINTMYLITGHVDL